MRSLPAAVLAASLLVASAPIGARAASLEGIVTDADTGDPLPFASVVATSDAGRTGALAGPDGSWRLDGLAAGRWVVEWHYIGYADRADTVDVAADEVRILDAALAPEAIPVEKVEVRADPIRPETGAPGVVSLSAGRIRALPAFGETDPIRTLQFLPGVQAASDVSSGLYVRGGGPDQTLVRLDDVTIYNPTHAFGLFSTFNADAVGDVTLWKGAYPARWGGRLGAVLDVAGREGARDEGVRGRLGLSTIAARLSLEGPAGRGSWFLGGRRTYLEPILDAVRSEDNEIPAYYFWDGNAKLVLPGRRAGRFEATAYAGRDDLHLDLDDDTFVDVRWGNAAAVARGQRLLGDDLLGTLALSASEYRGETRVQLFTTPFSVENRLRDVTLRGDVVKELGSGRRISAGVEASRYEFLFEQAFNGEDQVSADSSPFEIAIHAEDEWTDGPLRLRTGVRARFLDGRRLLEPRVSGTWDVSPRWTVKGGGGLYHQLVQLVGTEGFSGGDFYLPLDGSVDPGRAWQGTLGAEWSPRAEWRVTAEVYGTRLEDLVELDDEASTDRDENDAESFFRTDGRGWAAGLELFGERRAGAVTGWLGYTLGWTRREFPGVNGDAPYPPKYDRRHDVNAVGVWERGPWRFSGAFVLGTGQAFTPATARFWIRNPATGAFTEEGQVLPGEKNSARLLPYHRLDVAVARAFTLFGRPAEWTAQVFNLYSRRNEWFVQYDRDGERVEPRVFRQLPVIPSLGLSVEF